ncbi:hypothetical protein FLM9_233 [Candidatus Synechococcus spongiarum]|uniref:Uncharacterized protein n=1 Tax=Candidatus Synechococcus spongiarum TaxID=431041 RepID=A0A164Z376_9SYNE|nr:hypothetical protein FLM9_233 [Candidatus Synechococcus spongiarum]
MLATRGEQVEAKVDCLLENRLPTPANRPTPGLEPGTIRPA